MRSAPVASSTSTAQPGPRLGIAPCLRPRRQPVACCSGNYAVISLGGQKQYVEEGSSFISKVALEEVTLGGAVRFQKVLALKLEGELLKGRPYVEGAVVEGRLEDEFRGPAAWSSISMASQDDDSNNAESNLVRRILVTRIQQSQGATTAARS